MLIGGVSMRFGSLAAGAATEAVPGFVGMALGSGAYTTGFTVTVHFFH
jgi:hypothetical protein